MKEKVEKMKAKRIILPTITIITMMIIALTTVMGTSAEITETSPTVNVTEPTAEPTVAPTVELTEAPTVEPTVAPTEAPDPSIPHITSTENTRTGIKIKWSEVDGASKYRVFVKSGSKWKKIGDTSKKYLTYKTDKNNKTYSFTVRCITSNGKKYTSSYDKVGFKATYFAVPKLKSVTNTTKGVKFTWNAVDGIDEYRVFVKRAGADSWTNKGIVDTTSYTHTSSVSGRKYIYTVRCVKDNKTVSSFNSSGKKITYVASPKVTDTKNTSSGTKLTWKKCNGAYKYRVFVKSGSKWKKLGDTKSTSFTYTSAKNNTEYKYTIRCCNSSGKYVSAYNKDGYIVTYYNAPSLKSVTNTTKGVKFTWSAVDGIDEYRVYVKVNGSSWTKKADTRGTSYSDTSVDSGNKYTYTVKCLKNNKVVSSHNSKGKSTTFISSPVITRATLDKNNNVKLTWNNINGAYKYRVFVKSGSEWKAVGYTTNTAYTLKNLKNNTEYTYTVRCCNEDNKYISDYIRDNCTFTKNLVIDQEAYTEETLLYEEVIRGICNKCGKDITDDIFDTNSEYYGWDGYKYHVLVDGCQSAWHTEPHWWNILENRLATEQECNDASNPYLYNETHNDKLERRYCYTACCYVKDCEHYGNFYQEHTIEFYSSDTMNRVKGILEEHKAYHLAKGDRSDSYAGSNEQIYRIINHPEINHYELTIK